MPPDDGTLILQIKQKNLNAFDQLFMKYKTSVYRFGYYLTQNSTEADDLFQETWLRAIRYIPTTPEINNFKAWIYTIMTNVHRDELRKKQIRRIFSPMKQILSDLPHKSKDDSDRGILPAVNDESNRIEIGIALSKAIAKLSIKQRRIFVLKEIEGFKHHEIGEILDLPVGTVKSLLHRAMKNLQKELSDFNSK